MTQTLAAFGHYTVGLVPDLVQSFFVAHDDLALLTEPPNVVSFLTFLRPYEHFLVSQVLDCTVVELS